MEALSAKGLYKKAKAVKTQRKPPWSEYSKTYLDRDHRRVDEAIATYTAIHEFEAPKKIGITKAISLGQGLGNKEKCEKIKKIIRDGQFKIEHGEARDLIDCEAKELVSAVRRIGAGNDSNKISFENFKGTIDRICNSLQSTLDQELKKNNLTSRHVEELQAEIEEVSTAITFLQKLIKNIESALKEKLDESEESNAEKDGENGDEQEDSDDADDDREDHGGWGKEDEDDGDEENQDQ